MKNPNLDLIRAAAERLRPLLKEMVFVGGCTTGLLITDQAAAPVRGTNDVDAIAEIASYADYVIFLSGFGRVDFRRIPAKVLLCAVGVVRSFCWI